MKADFFQFQFTIFFHLRNRCKGQNIGINIFDILATLTKHKTCLNLSDERPNLKVRVP